MAKLGLVAELELDISKASKALNEGFSRSWKGFLSGGAGGAATGGLLGGLKGMERGGVLGAVTGAVSGVLGAGSAVAGLLGSAVGILEGIKTWVAKSYEELAKGSPSWKEMQDVMRKTADQVWKPFGDYIAIVARPLAQLQMTLLRSSRAQLEKEVFSKLRTGDITLEDAQAKLIEIMKPTFGAFVEIKKAFTQMTAPIAGFADAFKTIFDTTWVDEIIGGISGGLQALAEGARSFLENLLLPNVITEEQRAIQQRLVSAMNEIAGNSTTSEWKNVMFSGFRKVAEIAKIDETELTNIEAKMDDAVSAAKVLAMTMQRKMEEAERVISGARGGIGNEAYIVRGSSGAEYTLPPNAWRAYIAGELKI